MPAKTRCRVVLPSSSEAAGALHHPDTRLERPGHAGNYFATGSWLINGGFFNAQTGRMSSVPVNPELWAKTRRLNRRLLAA